MKWILKYIRGSTKACLGFDRRINEDTSHVTIFCDSNYVANFDHRRSLTNIVGFQYCPAKGNNPVEGVRVGLAGPKARRTRKGGARMSLDQVDISSLVRSNESNMEAQPSTEGASHLSRKVATTSRSKNP
ncbi:hypothetical protein CR513_55853, partial [Mucuna pruriens]